MSVRKYSVSIFFFQIRQIPKQVISKYKNCTQVLYLVAHIESIFIPEHYKKIIKYLIVYWKAFHSDWYVDLFLWQIMLYLRISFWIQIYRKWLVRGSNKMKTMWLHFEKWTDFFVMQKEQFFNVFVYQKNLFGKILRIQMLIYRTLSNPSPHRRKRILRNVVTKLLPFWQTSNLFSLCLVVDLVLCERPWKSETRCLTVKQTGT